MTLPRAVLILTTALPLIADAANCERRPDHQPCTNPPSPASAEYVLFLDQYIYGDYYLANVPSLDGTEIPLSRPEAVRIQGFSGRLGNPDVSRDGSFVVFAGFVRNDWNIYRGELDVVGRQITDVRALLNDPRVREEDPRLSWDGQHVAYKRDGSIFIANVGTGARSLVAQTPGCELYGPSFHPNGLEVSYTARCGDEASDRIRTIALNREGELLLPAGSPPVQVRDVSEEGTDRFPHYLTDGRLVYAHTNGGGTDASLWAYQATGPDTGFGGFFHDRTMSDDDPYAHKSDPDLLAFSGYGTRYDLYVYRLSTQDSLQLSAGINVLGAVLFRVP